MTHAMAARFSVWLFDRAARMRDQRGQGTVEYVGIVVTMTLLLGGVALAARGWGDDIGKSLKEVLKDAVGFASSKLTERR